MTQSQMATLAPDSICLQIRAGYLYLSAEVAEANFASGVLIVQPNFGRLEIFPVASAANGGLIVKVRDALQNRSVLIDEAIRDYGTALDGDHRFEWSGDRGCFWIDIDRVLGEPEV